MAVCRCGNVMRNERRRREMNQRGISNRGTGYGRVFLVSCFHFFVEGPLKNVRTLITLSENSNQSGNFLTQETEKIKF